MTRYIAFLRAINVGGHTVKMDRLRSLCEELDLACVETFIASGNVIFESTAKNAQALEGKIASHLEKSLGYGVGTFIRSVSELAAIAGHRPFKAADADDPRHSFYIAFTSAEPSADAQKRLMALSPPRDELAVHRREIYWLCRGKFSESTFSGALLEKAIGMPATLRSVTTVRKLTAKYPA